MFLRVPSPIPFPKKPPLVIDSIALSDWKLWDPVSLSKNEKIRLWMYSNLGTKIIKYASNTELNKKIAINKYKLIPEVKIRTAQEKITNKVWPISGWIIKSDEIKVIIKIESIYLDIIFALLLQRIVAKVIIKKGFKTSIGWNLGKKNKSIHLFEPFTSIPIIGTKNKENKDIMKRIIEYLNNWSVLNEEKIKIIEIPIKT